MAVEFDIVYDGNLICRAVHGPSRQTLTTDAPTDNGGRGSAFSPTDLVATALATCMLTIMGLVAQRRGWNIDGTQCHVVKEMVADPVRRIGRLTVHMTLPSNPELDEAARESLRQAALTCPVKESLHPNVEVILEMH